MTKVELGVTDKYTMQAPSSPLMYLMPEQASLIRSSFPFDGPLKGHSQWDLASITLGLAKSYLCQFYFISIHSGTDNLVNLD